MKTAKQFAASLPVWTRHTSVIANASPKLGTTKPKRLTKKQMPAAILALRARFGKA